MKKIKKSLWASSLLAVPTFLLLGVSVVLAQASGDTEVYDIGDFQKVFCTFLGYFFWFIIVLSVIMALVAAFDYITAGDDTEKTTRGRKRLTYAAIGIVIALMAFVFPTIVSSLFTGSGLVQVSTTSCITSG